MNTSWLYQINNIKYLGSKFRLFLIAIIFFGFAIIITYPAIFHLSDKLIGDGGDNYQNLIFQFIAAQKIKSFQFPFSHTDVLRYPVGFSFETGFESVISVLIGAFLSLIFSSIFSYNITVLLLFLLNGLFSFLLFRYISKSYLLGIIGSIVYGYSSFVIARSAGHLNLLFIGGFPLFIFSLLKIKDDFKIRNAAVVFTAATLIFLGSFQYSLLFSISFLICLPLVMFFFPRSFQFIVLNAIKNINKILLLLLPFFIIIMIFVFPYIKAFTAHDYFKPNRTDSISILQNSPSIKDYILPNTYLPLQITEFTKNLNNSFKSIDRIVYIGWAELFLFFAYILFYKNKKLKYFLISVTSIFFILSLGFINPESKLYLPYYFLHRIFPFSFIDEPTRFFVIFYLFLTISIILFLRQIYLNNAKTVVIFSFIVGLIVLERLPFNYWLAPTFTDNAFSQVVRRGASTAVLDIPVSYVNSVYDILPYAYQKKSVSGQFQWFADTNKPKSFIQNNNLIRFICGENSTYKNLKLENNNLIQVLKKYQITTIVVHKNDPIDHAKYYFPECANVRMQTSILLPQLLMPDSTEKQKILSLFFPAIPTIGDTITFPDDGIFYLDGFHAFPNDWLPLHIYLNGKEILFKQNWTDRGNQNATLDPFLKLDVKKGSKLSFAFDKNNNSNYSFVKIWYRYVPKSIKHTEDYLPQYPIAKIFEDDDAAVFSLK